MHAPMLEILIYCEADGTFVLKPKGEDGVHRFPDIRTAMAFVWKLDPQKGSTLVIYNHRGRVILQTSL